MVPDDIENGRTGRPDILIKVDGGYLPADVKNHLTLTPLKTRRLRAPSYRPSQHPMSGTRCGWTAATTHRYEDGLQLAHYTRMLAGLWLPPGPDHVWGAVLGTSQVDGDSRPMVPELVFVWHNLDEPLVYTFSRSQGKTRRSLLERYDHEHALPSEGGGERPPSHGGRRRPAATGGTDRAGRMPQVPLRAVVRAADGAG